MKPALVFCSFILILCLVGSSSRSWALDPKCLAAIAGTQDGIQTLAQPPLTAAELALIDAGARFLLGQNTNGKPAPNIFADEVPLSERVLNGIDYRLFSLEPGRKTDPAWLTQLREGQAVERVVIGYMLHPELQVTAVKYFSAPPIAQVPKILLVDRQFWPVQSAELLDYLTAIQRVSVDTGGTIRAKVVSKVIDVIGGGIADQFPSILVNAVLDSLLSPEINSVTVRIHGSMTFLSEIRRSDGSTIPLLLDNEILAPRETGLSSEGHAHNIASLFVPFDRNQIGKGIGLVSSVIRSGTQFHDYFFETRTYISGKILRIEIVE